MNPPDPDVLPANGPTAVTVSACVKLPATVQSLPSVEYDIVQTSPARSTRRYGALPPGIATLNFCELLPPSVAAAKA